MAKPIKRFHEAILIPCDNKRPFAGFVSKKGNINGGRTSRVIECSFNEDGTLNRIVTNNSIYVQVKE
ncbi:hypothetical protein [Xanthomonas virus PB119]|nr:hypothetical protein [Xanthomonas virus PB119]